jgi:hypothetical protein
MTNSGHSFYGVENGLVMITIGPLSTFNERQALYDAIRRDPRVPDDAVLLLDVRLHEEVLTPETVRARVPLLKNALGPKLGSAFALLATRDRMPDAMIFQAVAGEFQFRVGVFYEEALARTWLTAYLPPSAA